MRSARLRPTGPLYTCARIVAGRDTRRMLSGYVFADRPRPPRPPRAPGPRSIAAASAGCRGVARSPAAPQRARCALRRLTARHACSRRTPGVRRRLGGGRLHRRGARPRGRRWSSGAVGVRSPTPRQPTSPSASRASAAAGDDQAGSRASGACAGAGVRPGEAARGRGSARRTGVPPARAPRRRGPARSRLGASRSERLERGRIDVSVRRAVPSRAVLVDDVHTTGATLDACARALRGAGAAEVVALTWGAASRSDPCPRLQVVRSDPVDESRTISLRREANA